MSPLSGLTFPDHHPCISLLTPRALSQDLNSEQGVSSPNMTTNYEPEICVFGDLNNVHAESLSTVTAGWPTISRPYPQ